MNEWALITGASAGIGLELARLFAADHFNVILVSRNRPRLEQLASELQAKHGISAKVFAKDLSSLAAPEELFDALRDTPVSVLVNNAGFGWRGRFTQGEISRSLEMMHVNMDALVRLTHLFAQPMLARRQGRILNVASTAAFQPGPLTAIYFATKAFVFSFSVALGQELEATGVTVTTFCPGGTETEFFARAGMGDARPRMYLMKADKVARIGYRACLKGKPIVIAGALNKVSSSLARRAPVRLTARIVKWMNGGGATPPLGV
jgi:uncharacterized protein